MGTALAPIKPKEFGEYMERQRGNLERISGKHVDVERLVTTVLLCMGRNPALLTCTSQSVFRAVMQATEMGLLPGSGNGDAYLVPYGKECTLIPGYRGYVRLAIDSGKVLDVQPRAVFKGDVFDYAFGLNPRLDHVPSGNTDPADLTHAYVVVYLANGLTRFDVMTRAEIDKIRAQSAGKNGDLWTKHFVAAAKKCPIRRDAKFWPQSKALQKAMALDNALDVGDAGLMEFEIPESQPEETQKIESAERVQAARKNMRREPNLAEQPAPEAPTATHEFTPEQSWEAIYSHSGLPQGRDARAKHESALLGRTVGPEKPPTEEEYQQCVKGFGPYLESLTAPTAGGGLPMDVQTADAQGNLGALD